MDTELARQDGQQGEVFMGHLTDLGGEKVGEIEKGQDEDLKGTQGVSGSGTQEDEEVEFHDASESDEVSELGEDDSGEKKVIQKETRKGFRYFSDGLGFSGQGGNVEEKEGEGSGSGEDVGMVAGMMGKGGEKEKELREVKRALRKAEKRMAEMSLDLEKNEKMVQGAEERAREWMIEQQVGEEMRWREEMERFRAEQLRKQELREEVMKRKWEEERAEMVEAMFARTEKVASGETVEEVVKAKTRELREELREKEALHEKWREQTEQVMKDWVERMKDRTEEERQVAVEMTEVVVREEMEKVAREKVQLEKERAQVEREAEKKRYEQRIREVEWRVTKAKEEAEREKEEGARLIREIEAKEEERRTGVEPPSSPWRLGKTGMDRVAGKFRESDMLRRMGGKVERRLREPNQWDHKNAAACGTRIVPWDAVPGQWRVVLTREVKAREFVGRFELGKVTRDTDPRHCVMRPDGTIGDGSAEWGFHSFVNHSCDPTTALVPDPVDERKFALMAKRDMRVGWEVTFDYGQVAAEGEKRVPCKCRAPMCRGWIEREEEGRLEFDSDGEERWVRGMAAEVVLGGRLATEGQRMRVREGRGGAKGVTGRERRHTGGGLSVVMGGSEEGSEREGGGNRWVVGSEVEEEDEDWSEDSEAVSVRMEERRRERKRAGRTKKVVESESEGGSGVGSRTGMRGKGREEVREQGRKGARKLEMGTGRPAGVWGTSTPHPAPRRSKETERSGRRPTTGLKDIPLLIDHVDKVTGVVSAREWLSLYEAHAQRHGWDQHTKLVWVGKAIETHEWARQWHDVWLADGGGLDYDEWKEGFASEFQDTPAVMMAAREEWNSLRMKPGEAAAVFYIRFLRAQKRVSEEGKMPAAMEEYEAMVKYVEALTPALRQQVKLPTIGDTLVGLRAQVQMAEVWVNRERKPSAMRRAAVGGVAEGEREGEGGGGVDPVEERRKEREAEKKERDKEREADRKERAKEREAERKRRQKEGKGQMTWAEMCWRCPREGTPHRKGDCPAGGTVRETRDGGGGASGAPTGPRICWTCGEVGHFSTTCRLKGTAMKCDKCGAKGHVTKACGITPGTWSQRD